MGAARVTGRPIMTEQGGIVQFLASGWCSIHSNLGCLSVSTCTGYRRSAYDPNGIHMVLEDSVTNEQFGIAIRDALEASKPLKEERVSEFFDLENIE